MDPWSSGGKLGGFRDSPFYGILHQQERRTMAKSNETKVAEKLVEGLNDYTFSPAVLANVLTTYYPMYTQDRLMELVKWIIKYNALRMRTEWDKGNTSEGLLMADLLNDTLVTRYGNEHIDTSLFEDKRVRDEKYVMDLDSF